jgi:hypothetical protein
MGGDAENTEPTNESLNSEKTGSCLDTWTILAV